MPRMHPARALQSAAAQATRPAHWLEYLARWGFVANAIVYLVVGGLAMRWALGEGGRITDPDGAFVAIRRATGGTSFLIFLAAGFFSYALWRVLAAVFDGDGNGSSFSGVANRIFGVIKGAAYTALGIDALQLARGTRTGGSAWPDALASNPVGRVSMFLIAGGILAFAAFEMYRAYGAKLSQGLRLHALGATARAWVVGIARFGIGARAVVIATFGVLLLGAAVSGRVSDAPGTTESIRKAGHSEPLLYLAIGAGLFAYGLYLVVLSRYRQVRAA